MGAITESVRRHVPATYKAMIGPSETTDYYSLNDLQTLANYVIFRLFSTELANPTEEAEFNPRQIEFIGKVTTLKFIPAAIDYWMDQSETVETHGPEESEDFPSRLAHLQELFKRLSAEVADEWDEVLGISGKTSWAPGVSYGDNGRGILITPDPQEFGPVIKSRPRVPGVIPSLDHFLGEELV
jgi:hypothetical protein